MSLPEDSVRVQTSLVGALWLHTALCDDMLDLDSIISQLHDLARRPAAFRCVPVGNDDANEHFIAHIVHYLESPCQPKDLVLLPSILGELRQDLQAFYSKHDGLVLYRDTLSSAAGVQVYPLRALSAVTESLRRRMKYEGDDRQFPYLCFATAPRSGNFFVIRPMGRMLE